MPIGAANIILRTPTWNPLKEGSNLLAWYDASDSATVLNGVGPDVPATSGQTVRRLLDKSGNSVTLDQATGTAQPTLTGGGLAFDAVDDALASGSWVVDAVPLTIVVAAIEGGTSNTRDYINTGFNRGYSWNIASRGHSISGAGSSAYSFVPASGRRVGLVYVWEAGSSPITVQTTTAQQTGYVGAGVRYGGLFAHGGIFGYQTTALALGGGTPATTCTLFEVAVVRGAMDDATARAALRYMTNKWGTL